VTALGSNRHSGQHPGWALPYTANKDLSGQEELTGKIIHGMK